MRINKLSSLIVGLAALAMGSIAGAATITVGSGGQDHTTIGAAVTAAVNGDTIEVYSGTYNESLAITKSNLTLKEAAGETAIFAPQTGVWVLHVQGGGSGFTWEGIDANMSYAVLGFLVQANNVTFRNFEMFDTNTVPSPNGWLFGFVYDNSFTIENVTAVFDEAEPPLMFCAGNAVGPVVTIKDSIINSHVTGDAGVLSTNGRQGGYIIDNSTIRMPNTAATAPTGPLIVGTDPASAESTLVVTGSTLIGEDTCTQLARNMSIDATQSRFDFSNSLGSASVHEASQHVGTDSYENCHFLISAGNKPWLMEDLKGGGALSLVHTTVVATNPSTASTLLVASPGAAATSTLTVRNNILKLTGSTVGVASGNANATINVVAGTNLRNYGSVFPSDKLTGTIISNSARLEADNLTPMEFSPAVGAGENLGLTVDIDGDARGSNPDLGAKEVAFVPVEASSFQAE